MPKNSGVFIVAREWILKAENDLITASYLLTNTHFIIIIGITCILCKLLPATATAFALATGFNAFRATT